MKFKTKMILLTATIIGAGAMTFAGCKIGEMTMDDYLSSNGVTDQCVTYYGNGGTFKSNSRDSVDVYYKPNSPIITTNGLSNFEFIRLNYTFNGWHYVEVDADGKPVLDENGDAKLQSPISSTITIKENQHLYVAANWLKNVELEVYLVTDGFTVTANETTYKSGDLIKTTSSFGALSQSQHAVSTSDATFLCFYEDEECTKPIQTVSRPTDLASENVKIYAKYLQGKWTVVSNSNAVLNMFDKYAEGGKYYLFTPNGSNTITYTGRDIALKSGDCNITIEGNGVTVENLSFANTRMSGGNYAILGNLTKDASIKDLTLKNVKVSAGVQSGSLHLYLLAHGYAGAKISGLVFDGVKYDISAPSTAHILNIERGTATTDENWLFGGLDTDDKFIAEVGGVQVKNATLTYTVDRVATTVAENISK